MTNRRPEDRLARARDAIGRAEADWLLVPASADFRWLTGGRARATERLLLIALPRTGEPWCLVPRLEADALAAECPWLDLEVWDEHEDPLARLAGRIGLERRPALLLGEGFRTGPLLDLAARAPSRPAAPVLAPLRACKDADELAALQTAGRNADRVMAEAAAQLRPGLTERQIARFILDRFDALGDHDAWAIVAAGPNSALPHHMTADRPLAAGEAVLLDLGAYHDGYASDITRTFHLGAPDAEFEKVYALVDAARAAGIATVRAGVAAAAVDRAARTVIERGGYGPRFVHRTGHGVGLEIHEPPYLVAGNEAPLAAGMVHSVEPGIYLTGRFGVRLEDLVVVETAGARRLNDAPFAPALGPGATPAAPAAGLRDPATTHEILAGLNPEQLAAVTHGEGPLLIVAGAGTGKTAVITRRIAWLIATKRARPEEILALTFTDKAAAEMESRVDVLVPYGMVGATLATFHAFCDRLVREHAVELGITSRLQVGTRADMLVFLRERLFELGLERYLPLGSPDRHLDALLSVFDRARDEDVSPEAYHDFAGRLADEAGDDPVLRDRAEAELEKARAYAAYQRLLLASGRVDFGSQIGLALRLLRERPHLRREYQETFRWILVDEFQDTNHVQFELVKLLTAGRRNLTVVGDDDQSIYRFRGAKVENLLGFPDAFPGAKTVLLRRNYRSGQGILDRAHRLVKFNDPERLEARDPERFDKRLVADRAIAGTVEIWPFAGMTDEAEAVAEDIAAAIGRGERAAKDIAVLARTHAQLDPVAAALKGRGLRFQRANQRGLYRRPEVMLCLNVLRSVADPDDGVAVYGVLGDPLFGIDADDLGRLTAQAKRRRRGLRALAVAAANDPASPLSPRSREGVRRFADLHARLGASATRRPTSEVLYEFASESGLLERLAHEESAEATEQVQNLSRLFGIVQRVGPLLRSDRVPFFMEHLDLLIEAGDDPQAAAVDPDEDAVQLLTAHNAKGLEFPVVYLVQLVEGRFPLQRRGEPLPFPPELHSGGDPRAEHEREERRLFYVAMTRARDRLVLTHAEDYGGRRTKKPSRFVVEALELPSPPKSRKSASALESIARYAPAAEPTAPEPAPLPPDRDLVLSHGQIDDWATCPLKYRYAHVVQVPLGSDPRVMYGIAIHHAIRVFHQHRLRGHPITADDVVRVFEEAWSSEGFFSREHEERRLEEGRSALRRFVERETASGRLPLAIEMEFRFRLGNDIVVGRWDRIDESGGEIALVDYKTGAIADREKADARAARSLKEDQLGLYALAYAETRQVMPARVQLHFVDSGLVGEARVEEQHLEIARERVREAAAGIRTGRFPADSDQRKCGDCPYSRFCVHSAARGNG